MTIHHRGGAKGDELIAGSVLPVGKAIRGEGLAGPDPSARAESPALWTWGARLDALTRADGQHVGEAATALADVAAGDKGAARPGGGINESVAAVPPLRQAGASSKDALAGTKAVPVASGDGLPVASLAAGRFWPETGNAPLQDLWRDDPFGPGPGDDWLGRAAEADSFAFHAGSDHDLAEDVPDNADRLVIQSAAEAWFDVRITQQAALMPIHAGPAGIVLAEFDPAPVSAPDFLF